MSKISVLSRPCLTHTHWKQVQLWYNDISMHSTHTHTQNQEDTRIKAQQSLGGEWSEIFHRKSWKISHFIFKFPHSPKKRRIHSKQKPHLECTCVHLGFQSSPQRTQKAHVGFISMCVFDKQKQHRLGVSIMTLTAEHFTRKNYRRCFDVKQGWLPLRKW